MNQLAENALITTKSLHNTLSSDLDDIAKSLIECDQSFVCRDTLAEVKVDVKPFVTRVVKKTVREQENALSSSLEVLQEQMAALQEARAHQARLDLQILARDLQVISTSHAKRVLENNQRARQEVQEMKQMGDTSRLKEILEVIQSLQFRTVPSGTTNDAEMQRTVQGLRLQILDLQKKDKLYRDTVAKEKEKIQQEISSLASKSKAETEMTTQEKAEVVRLKKQIELNKYKLEQTRKKRAELEKDNSELKYRTEFTQRELKRIEEDQVRLEKEWGTEKSKLDLEIQQLQAQYTDISRTVDSDSGENALSTEVLLFQTQHQQAKDLILKERELFMKKKCELQKDRENMEKEMEELERQQGDLKTEERNIKKEAMAQLEAEKVSLSKEKERVKYLAKELQTAMKEIKNSGSRKGMPLRHRRSRSATTKRR